MILLISQNRPVDQKYNVLYFILGIQWFNLTAHDMRSSLINAVLENHRSQATPGTLMSHVTSPSSSASFKKASFLLLLAHQAENLVNPLSWRLMMLGFCDCFFQMLCNYCQNPGACCPLSTEQIEPMTSK